jgi:hypothetical protein
MDAETKQYLDRINSKLTLLIESKKKETWINANWLTDLTGWNGEKKRQAREQGLVKFKKTETGSYLYLLESISERFLIKTA